METKGKTGSDLIRLQEKRLKKVKQALEEARGKVSVLEKRAQEEKEVLVMLTGIVSNDEKVLKRLKRERKLILCLDLDHSLLHSRTYHKGDGDQEGAHLVEVALDEGGVKKFWVALRPGVREFLRAVDDHFELHVFTFGGRNYAREMVALLSRECDGIQFESVVSSTEWFNKTHKSIEPLFPRSKTKVLILDDDKDDVWGGCDNLIRVYPYFFFAESEEKLQKKLRTNEPVRIFQSQSASLSIHHVVRDVEMGIFAVYSKEDRKRAHDRQGLRHDTFKNVVSVLQRVYSIVYPDSRKKAKAIRMDTPPPGVGPGAAQPKLRSEDRKKNKKRGKEQRHHRHRGHGHGHGRRQRAGSDTPGSPASSASSSGSSSSGSSTGSSPSTTTPSSSSSSRSSSSSSSWGGSSSNGSSSSGSGASEGTHRDVRVALREVRPPNILAGHTILVVGGTEKFNKELVQLSASMGASVAFLSADLPAEQRVPGKPLKLVMTKHGWDFTLSCHASDPIFYVTLHNADFAMCETVHRKALRGGPATQPIPIQIISVAWLVDTFLLWDRAAQGAVGQGVPGVNVEEYFLDPNATVNVSYVPGMLIIEKAKHQAGAVSGQAPPPQGAH